MSQIVQHRINSIGNLLDRIRRGDKTPLQAFEFDLMLPPGANKLVIGHPANLRKTEKNPNGIDLPTDVKVFIDKLAQLRINRLVIDCKAEGWDAAKNAAVFSERELEVFDRDLPGIIQQLQEQTAELHDARRSEVVVSSTSPEFFTAERNAQMRDLGTTLCFFPKRDDETAVKTAIGLGVDRVDCPLPSALKRTELLQKYKADLTGSAVKIGFTEVNTPEIRDEILAVFPDAELISDRSEAIEKTDRKEAAAFPRFSIH